MKNEIVEIVPESVNCRKIVEQLAIKHPAIYHDLVDPVNGFKKECVRLYLSGNKTEAIKLYRYRSGLTFYESKEAVEYLVAEVNKE